MDDKRAKYPCISPILWLRNLKNSPREDVRMSQRDNSALLRVCQARSEWDWARSYSSAHAESAAGSSSRFLGRKDHRRGQRMEQKRNANANKRINAHLCLKDIYQLSTFVIIKASTVKNNVYNEHCSNLTLQGHYLSTKRIPSLFCRNRPTPHLFAALYHKRHETACKTSLWEHATEQIHESTSPAPGILQHHRTGPVLVHANRRACYGLQALCPPGCCRIPASHGSFLLCTAMHTASPARFPAHMIAVSKINLVSNSSPTVLEAKKTKLGFPRPAFKPRSRSSCIRFISERF